MNSKQGQRISLTESLCPQCLSKIPAELLLVGHEVYLSKTCPAHGDYATVVWRGQPSLTDWLRVKIPYSNPAPNTITENGCPFDCGLCPQHAQQTCTALLEVTKRCNLNCAYCFANSVPTPSIDPELSTIRKWYETLLSSGRVCNVQLSGGEPTMRDDLTEVIAIGKQLGFDFIQLNTNGLRLAFDKDYASSLKAAGLSSVFLQFDGTSPEIYLNLRGRDIYDDKLEAIRNCEQNGLGVTLVPTLVPGVNTDDVGNILRFAAERLEVVRGVHFQPVSYFGRYPSGTHCDERLTLPELMKMIEVQTSGAIRMENFLPPGCENSMCSFHGNFVLMPNGELAPLTRIDSFKRLTEPELAETGAKKAREFVSRNWSQRSLQEDTGAECGINFGYWETLLSRSRTHLLCISAMAFQDVWNLDLNRLRECCIHVVAESGKIVPFCAYNLTSADGHYLYRGGG